MDERTPKAKQLVAMMKATMNLDLDELIQAGVIEDRDGQESSPWAKWNKDAPLFIAKLDDRQLNSLAALIAHKFPDAFARALKPEPFDSAGLRGAVAQTRETHASLYGPTSPDYRLCRLPVDWKGIADELAEALSYQGVHHDVVALAALPEEKRYLMDGMVRHSKQNIERAETVLTRYREAIK